MTEPLIKLPSMIVKELETQIADQKMQLADKNLELKNKDAEIQHLKNLVKQLSFTNTP